MVVFHAVTKNIRIKVVISLRGLEFFLLLHPASEEERQRKTRRNSDVDLWKERRRGSYLKGV